MSDYTLKLQEEIIEEAMKYYEMEMSYESCEQ